MSKKVFTIFIMLVLLIPAISNAQFMPSFGGYVGANFANASITPTQTTSTKTALKIGAFADLSFSPLISLVPGLEYISKGTEYTTGGYTVTWKFRLAFKKVCK